jgi:hypothetical protein
MRAERLVLNFLNEEEPKELRRLLRELIEAMED